MELHSLAIKIICKYAVSLCIFCVLSCSYYRMFMQTSMVHVVRKITFCQNVASVQKVLQIQIGLAVSVMQWYEGRSFNKFTKWCHSINF